MQATSHWGSPAVQIGLPKKGMAGKAVLTPEKKVSYPNFMAVLKDNQSSPQLVQALMEGMELALEAEAEARAKARANR
jgi:hypothetical protein